MRSGARLSLCALLAVGLAGCVDAQSYRCGAAAQCVRGALTGPARLIVAGKDP